MIFNICLHLRNPCTHLGYTQNHGPSDGIENESITFQSTEYAARSTIAEQIIASEYFKVSAETKTTTTKDPNELHCALAAIKQFME